MNSPQHPFLINPKLLALIQLFGAISITLTTNNAEASLLPVQRYSYVNLYEEVCSLSCFIEQISPIITNETQTSTDVSLNPLVNEFNTSNQHSFFDSNHIDASVTGSANTTQTEFGLMRYSSLFRLDFSLAQTHHFDLNGLIHAKWQGLSFDMAKISLTGPSLSEVFAIPSQFGAFDIQQPISISGTLFTGNYTFEVSIQGLSNTIESSALNAHATLNLTPVPLLPSYFLFITAISALGFQQHTTRKINSTTA